MGYQAEERAITDFSNGVDSTSVFYAEGARQGISMAAKWTECNKSDLTLKVPKKGSTVTCFLRTLCCLRKNDLADFLL